MSAANQAAGSVAQSESDTNLKSRRSAWQQQASGSVIDAAASDRPSGTRCRP